MLTAQVAGISVRTIVEASRTDVIAAPERGDRCRGRGRSCWSSRLLVPDCVECCGELGWAGRASEAGADGAVAVEEQDRGCLQDVEACGEVRMPCEVDLDAFDTVVSSGEGVELAGGAGAACAGRGGELDEGGAGAVGLGGGEVGGRRERAGGAGAAAGPGGAAASRAGTAAGGRRAHGGCPAGPRPEDQAEDGGECEDYHEHGHSRDDGRAGTVRRAAPDVGEVTSCDGWPAVASGE